MTALTPKIVAKPNAYAPYAMHFTGDASPYGSAHIQINLFVFHIPAPNTGLDCMMPMYITATNNNQSSLISQPHYSVSLLLHNDHQLHHNPPNIPVFHAIQHNIPPIIAQIHTRLITVIQLRHRPIVTIFLRGHHKTYNVIHPHFRANSISTSVLTFAHSNNSNRHGHTHLHFKLTSINNDHPIFITPLHINSANALHFHALSDHHFAQRNDHSLTLTRSQILIFFHQLKHTTIIWKIWRMG